jgi:hypothetical protein
MELVVMHGMGAGVVGGLGIRGRGGPRQLGVGGRGRAGVAVGGLGEMGGCVVAVLRYHPSKVPALGLEV